MSTAAQTLPRSLDEARAIDAADPLHAHRLEFELPRGGDGEPLVYLCGHSLGLMPRAARGLVAGELDDWARLAVEGHHRARRPWIDYADRAREGLAALTGADLHEVVAMNSLTVNLHLMLASFYAPRGQRRRILIEAGAFSSDRHAIAAQIAWHGLDPASELVELVPAPGESTLGTDAIEAAIEQQGERLALVLWPGVQYRTGEAFDCQRVAAAAHRVGAFAGFDHAHAIGNLPLDLHGDAADFAVWCSYKYLNAGPGAIGGAYVAARHAADPARLRLAGWWGHEAATRFRMAPGFQPERGAAGWALSNPPILSTAPLLASLTLFTAAGMAGLRARSLRLTGVLEALLRTHCGDAIDIVTPPDPARRGAQLSLRCGSPARARQLFMALQAAGVVGDLREPDILRLAPAPLYNGCADVWIAVDALRRSLAAGH
ncbi:MAG: kynureninase [Steroidobacteraceae bacterium]